MTLDGWNLMLSVVIPTWNSERALVPTLAMLVPGVMASAVREVIIVDGGSTDATPEVADFAGCALISSTGPLGSRLRAAAAAAREPWLMFLRPGVVLDTNWVPEAARFIEEAIGAGPDAQAAVFRRSPGVTRPRPVLIEVFNLLAAALGSPSPDQGLIIAKPFYERIGGHRDESDPEAGLLRRLGRRNIARLQTGISAPNNP
jgi:glycosyltransferase involved in cell wall biosynthesis